MKRHKARRHIKADSKIILSLEMTGAEMRRLRDDLFLKLCDWEMDNRYDDPDGLQSVRSTFEKWYAAKYEEAYRNETRPALEKLMVAIRVSLGLSPDLPRFHAQYPISDPKMADEDTLFDDWFKEKMSAFHMFYGPECMVGRGDALIEALGASLKMSIKEKDGLIFFGIIDSKQEMDPELLMGVRWTENLDEVKADVRKRFLTDVEDYDGP